MAIRFMARWDDVGATIYENGRAMSVDRILTLLNEYVEGDAAAYELANQTMDIVDLLHPRLESALAGLNGGYIKIAEVGYDGFMLTVCMSSGVYVRRYMCETAFAALRQFIEGEESQ